MIINRFIVINNVILLFITKLLILLLRVNNKERNVMCVGKVRTRGVSQSRRGCEICPREFSGAASESFAFYEKTYYGRLGEVGKTIISSSGPGLVRVKQAPRIRIRIRCDLIPRSIIYRVRDLL